ncbi:MAG: NADH-quinone oxidoreductase subunit J [candidate division NC10 bacterium]|nr:NADH-quinone oxidoreductase subunit J [candidate division NC10 bacterium]
MEWGIFLALTVLTVASALAVILHRNPIYSALALVATLLGLAGYYILLQAQLVAAVHVIVYAGAIMVLFLFVIMLLDVRREEGSPLRIGRLQLSLGTGAGTALLLLSSCCGRRWRPLPRGRSACPRPCPGRTRRRWAASSSPGISSPSSSPPSSCWSPWWGP